MICCKVTVTNANTGYNLWELIKTAYANIGPYGIPRVTSLTIQYLGSGNAYVVPGSGAYANTGGVPDQFGYSFSNGGALWDKNAVVNNIGLTEINLGSDTGGDQFAVLAFVA